MSIYRSSTVFIYTVDAVIYKVTEPIRLGQLLILIINNQLITSKTKNKKMNYFKLFTTLVKAMVKSLSTRQYVLTFEKESDNLWYIKMPWAGHHHNLQMVAGANHLLETFKSRLVTVRVSYEQKESTDICLTRQYYRIFGGATYKVSNLEGFTKEVWICPVTLFVLGKYPKRIYVSNSQK